MRSAVMVVLSLASCPGPRGPDTPPASGDCVDVDDSSDGVENGAAEQAEADIAAAIDEGRVAAAGVGVAVGTDAVWLHTGGTIGAAGATSSDTPFMLASVTKVVVATAIMQLVEDGALDLDVDVGLQAPLLAAVGNPGFPDVAITPRMLLTHTASIYDLPFTFDATWTSTGDSPVAMRDFVAGYFDPASDSFGGVDAWWPNAPGTFSCYSNMGVGVLGVLAEEVSGLSLEELTQARIFGPLGMTHTSFRADAFCDDVLARGVRAEGGGFVDDNLGAGPQPEGHPELASGMLKSSTRDLLVFATAIANGGALGDVRILDEATAFLMLTRQLDPALESCGDGRSDAAQQALGFTHFPDADGTDWAGHYGGMNGAGAAMWFVADTPTEPALAYVAVVNVADVAALFEVEAAVVRALPGFTAD